MIPLKKTQNESWPLTSSTFQMDDTLWIFKFTMEIIDRRSRDQTRSQLSIRQIAYNSIGDN
jgi:hypothetical protein